MNTENTTPSEETVTLMACLKEECHAFIDSLIAAKKTPFEVTTYDAAKDTWLFFKMAQMQEQINQLKIHQL